MCDEEYIMCFICDKRLKALASHLLHKHSISVITYLQIYPKASIISNKSRNLVSVARKGMKFSDEHCKHIGDGHRGKKLTEEQRQHIGDGHRGKKYKPMSDEGKHNLSIAHMGQHRSLEQIERTRISNTGKKRTPEQCKRMSDANKGKTKGIKRGPFSELHRQHLSDSKKGKAISIKSLEALVKYHTGRPLESDHRQKISLANKGRVKNKEECFNISESKKGHIVSELTREKIRKSLTGRTESIEHRKHISEGYRKRELHSGGSESLAHTMTKNKIRDMINPLGYVVTLERFITIGEKKYAIDVYAKKDDKTLLFEVGYCSINKILDLCAYYPYVYHVPKQKFLVDKIK